MPHGPVDSDVLPPGRALQEGRSVTIADAKVGGWTGVGVLVSRGAPTLLLWLPMWVGGPCVVGWGACA